MHAVQPPDDALVAAGENGSKGAVSQSQDLIGGILKERQWEEVFTSWSNSDGSGSVIPRKSSKRAPPAPAKSCAPRGRGRRAQTWPWPCLRFWKRASHEKLCISSKKSLAFTAWGLCLQKTLQGTVAGQSHPPEGKLPVVGTRHHQFEAGSSRIFVSRLSLNVHENQRTDGVLVHLGI